MLIMETQVSKLTLSHTPEQNRMGWFQSLTCECVKARGSQEWSFLHEVDFGHNMTIEVHCTTFE
jgi:hypothetical protein